MLYCTKQMHKQEHQKIFWDQKIKSNWQRQTGWLRRLVRDLEPFTSSLTKEVSQVIKKDVLLSFAVPVQMVAVVSNNLQQIAGARDSFSCASKSYGCCFPSFSWWYFLHEACLQELASVVLVFFMLFSTVFLFSIVNRKIFLNSLDVVKFRTELQKGGGKRERVAFGSRSDQIRSNIFKKGKSENTFLCPKTSIPLNHCFWSV